MPTYEYLCSFCGHAFELFMSMTEPAKKRCPKCKKGAKRLMGSGAGIVFKGSGFYQTDYKRTSPAPSKEVKADSAAVKPKTESDKPTKPTESTPKSDA